MNRDEKRWQPKAYKRIKDKNFICFPFPSFPAIDGFYLNLGEADLAWYDWETFPVVLY